MCVSSICDVEWPPPLRGGRKKRSTTNVCFSSAATILPNNRMQPLWYVSRTIKHLTFCNVNPVSKI